MEVDVEPDRQHLGGESNGFSLKRRPDCESMLSGSPACIINPEGAGIGKNMIHETGRRSLIRRSMGFRDRREIRADKDGIERRRETVLLALNKDSREIFLVNRISFPDRVAR